MSTESELISLKSRCVTPLLQCPRRKSRPDCPFEPLRKMEIVESVLWLKQQTAGELRALLAHHRACARDPEPPRNPRDRDG